ncbi:MAG: DUF1501 domain-containing protein [Gemmataceae bacterium]
MMNALLNDWNRRSFLRRGAVGLGVGLSGWMAPLARAIADDKQRRRSCILLWMNGGPSTIDLWDLKPGHENGGPSKETATAVPGIRISEHLPELARQMNNMAILRGMSTKEGDHVRGAYLMRTGQLPAGAIQYPSIGSLLSKELGNAQAELPNFISIASQRFGEDGSGPGFLGPAAAPLFVGTVPNNEPTPEQIDGLLKVKNIQRPRDVAPAHGDARLELLRDMQNEFLLNRDTPVTQSHVSAYERAARLMQSAAGRAFDLSEEKRTTREKYGMTLFGQGCLLARRLVERNVPFIEVSLSGWDTHASNFNMVRQLAGQLDRAWSTLMKDLQERGLLESTLIVCTGEFGRTPKINPQRGRDHFPAAWSAVLAGGGIKGGQTIGTTSPDGMTVTDRPVSSVDFLATICHAIGVDPDKQNLSNVGRPIRIVDQSAKPVLEVVRS